MARGSSPDGAHLPRRAIRRRSRPPPPPEAFSSPPPPEEVSSWSDLQAEIDRRRRLEERRVTGQWRRSLVEKEDRVEVVWRMAGEPAPASNALRLWKKRSGWSRSNARGVFTEAIRTAWEPSLSSSSRVESYRDGVLMVGISHQALLWEASQFRSTELTNRLRNALPDGPERKSFRRIHFKSG